MKHIKLFLEGFDKSKYYQEITAEESRRLTYDTGSSRDLIYRDFFNKEDIEFLSKVLRNISWYGHGGVDKYLDCIFSDGKISKLQDDWYVVSHWGRVRSYWKCDQFEGLVELLKDKGIIK
jgi:hypothetical protein